MKSYLEEIWSQKIMAYVSRNFGSGAKYIMILSINFMDLYIEGRLTEIIKIFRLLGFEITKKNKYFSAKLKQPNGRFHIMFSKFENKIYCDFHFDYTIHLLFLGVDYKKKPKEFFERNLRKILENKKIPFKIDEVDWFTRRNRAIFSGFRL